ncbi:ISNCY family transposase, partial [Yersinia pestis]
PRSKRLKRPYQPRYNRDCFGELIQIDGSYHNWFEGRASKCCLLVYIDDATGKLLHLRFCEAETTFDYMLSTRAYIEQYGKPLAFYSDKLL